MKAFNKNKALRKINLQQNKNTYIKRLSISLSCLFLLLCAILLTFAKFETSSDVFTLINGQVKVNICQYQIGKEWTFNYTGDVQNFNAPCNGEYKLEVWGAQGGNSNDSDYHGGYGAYSVGNTKLDQSDNIYVAVGSQGQTNCNLTVCTGGYNGGGSAGYYTGGSVYNGGGGGATHIATTNRGVLSNYNSYRNDILIVAGGGGAGTAHNNTSTFGYKHSGGNGGGISGTGSCGSSDYADTGSSSGCGGNQTATGAITSTTSTYGTYGGFGYGATNTCSSSYSGETRKCYAPGAGGGWYGGSTGTHGTGGGGSGYIASSKLESSNGIIKHMSCVDCETSEVVNTKTITNTCHNTNPTADCAKEGNGYAKITLISTTDIIRISNN